jgi:hypothetical protein
MFSTRPVLLALAALFATAVPATAGARVVDRPAARAALAPRGATAAKSQKVRKPTWLRNVAITEYYPVPESFFVGKKVRAPGLAGVHRIDWLYSARGLTMEGDGVGLDGRRYHVNATGHGGWVDKLGRASCIGCSGGVYWRAGGFWRNSAKRLTFPLDGGGWFNGLGRKYVPLPGVSFGSGPSLDLTYYASLAVDPAVIPLGSRVYIPYYKQHGLGTGWFRAQDTGGAIGGKHVDVFRSPPASLDDGSRSLSGQRIYVIPPR